MGYKDWRKYLYCKPYQTDRIDETRYRLHVSQEEKKKIIIQSVKTIKQKIKKIKERKVLWMIKN
jgi:hypothetical protein